MLTTEEELRKERRTGRGGEREGEKRKRVARRRNEWKAMLKIDDSSAEQQSTASARAREKLTDIGALHSPIRKAHLILRRTRTAYASVFFRSTTAIHTGFLFAEWGSLHWFPVWPRHSDDASNQYCRSNVCLHNWTPPARCRWQGTFSFASMIAKKKDRCSIHRDRKIRLGSREQWLIDSEHTCHAQW